MSEQSKPKRRWMPVLLIVSLAINLLVIGAVVGTALRVRNNDHVKAPPGFGSALYRALPKHERQAMRAELSGLHRQGVDHRTADFQALGDALRAEPFAADAVEALLGQQAQVMSEMQSALQEQWLIRVSAMSPKERVEYADRLEDVVHRKSKAGRKHD